MILDYDVIIIGAGPAGLAAAMELKLQGVYNIIVIERDSVPGGSPRYCLNPTFGLRVFKCPMTGKQFMNKFIFASDHIDILTNTTVLSIHPDGKLIISSTKGIYELSAKRIIIATGVYEKPRHTQLIAGSRPNNVFTSSTVLQLIEADQQLPFSNPVIIGSEMVSYSLLWNLYKKGIHTKAIIERNNKIATNQLINKLAQLYKVPVQCNSRLVEIAGNEHVEYIVIEQSEQQTKIMCDAVIFAGNFISETTLIKGSHLAHDPITGIPFVDIRGRCSDYVYYAVGNIVHPTDSADLCYQEGRKIGYVVMQDLRTPPVRNSVRVNIQHDKNILFTVPSSMTLDGTFQTFDMNIRVKQPVRGVITVKANDMVLYKKHHHCLPGQKILLKKIQADIPRIESTEVKVYIS